MREAHNSKLKTQNSKLKIQNSKLKMKILSLLLCGFALTMSAADEKASRGYKDPTYLQLYGGLNKSANEHLPWTEFSGYPWSGGAFVGIGREFTPLWGWRAALRFNHNKSRNVPKCEQADTWGWNSIGVFADATFDITDALASSKQRQHEPCFNLKAFAGVGAAWTFAFDEVPLSYTEPYSRDSRLVPAARAGITATWRLANQWRIGAEVSQTAFADNFNGVKANTPIDTRTNVKIGITYILHSKKREPMAAAPIVLDNRLRMVPALPLIMPKHEDTKRRVLKGRAFLDFPVNETIIYPKYRRNPQELRRIYNTIDHALFDKTIQVTSISLHGYASPESPYSNNTRLAKGRTAALKELLRKKYAVEQQLFRTDYTPEDWYNLRGFIATDGRRRVKGDIWYESADILETPEAPASVSNNRTELLRIVDLDMDADEKELLLKRVDGGKPYRWLLKNVYPGLRHTDYIIEYVVRGYPLKESKRLIYTHPEALSVEEMYRVAQSYDEGSDGWFDALTIAADQYPDDEVANLNAACACVTTKRLTDAKRYLQHAGSSNEATYVRGVIDAMEGNRAWEMKDGKLMFK